MNDSTDTGTTDGANDPVEMYLIDLAPKLPRKKRLDVMSELRSNLRDRVEELSAGDMSAHTAALQAVSELGDPNSLAAGYGGGRIIIPATRYHIFKAAVIVVVAIHLAASVITTIIGVDVTLLVLRIPSMRGWQVYEIATTLATQALADIGLITMLFWWADLSLPNVLPGLAIRPRVAEAKPHWAGLILPLIALGLLNVWRDEVLALHMVSPEGWSTVPILASQFVNSYLAPMNMVLLLALGVHTYKIISGPTAGVAAAELIYRLAAFTLVGALLSVSKPFDFPVGQIAALEPVFTGLFRLALLGTLFAYAFAVYRAGARLVQRLH